MPSYNGKISRKQGGDTIDVKTGGQITFNSSIQGAISNATTAATSSLAGAITAINNLGGTVNSILGVIRNLGIVST
jgi:hypothetical protein